MFAKCDILFLFILPGATGPQKEMSSMKYAFDNANLLDGTKDMRVQPGLCVLTDGETITDIVPAGTAPAGYARIEKESHRSDAETETRSPRWYLSYTLKTFEP